MRIETLSERMSALLDKLEETCEILSDLVNEAENLEFDLDTEARMSEDQAYAAYVIENLQAELRELEARTEANG